MKREVKLINYYENDTVTQLEDKLLLKKTMNIPAFDRGSACVYVCYSDQ